MAKFERCPRCGASLRPTKALAGGDSIFWRECSNSFCGTLIDTYEPYTMQYNFLKDPHAIKGVFGGYASGKSRTIIKDDEKHMLITPGGHVAVIGFTYRQINRNFKKDFDEDFPVALVKVTPGQKTPGFNSQDNVYTLKNGCKLELITADNIVKLRGLNATKITILEASNVSFPIFDSLKSRLRNQAASIFKKDEKGKTVMRFDEVAQEWVPDVEAEWHSMNLESNPDGNWINTEFLLKAESVYFYGNSYNKYQYLLDQINKDYSLHISATDANPYLPKNYLEVNTRGKKDYEIQRFYYGSFLFSENMVHPKVNEIIVDPYPIDLNDPNVFVIIGYDYGLADISAFVFGAVNFKKHLITYYDELSVNEMSVREIATEFRKKLSVIPDGKLLFLPKMDAKSFSKRGGDKVSLGSMFEEAGLLFEPIQEDPATRVMKTNSLIDNKQIQIFRTLTGLTTELKERKFKVDNKGNVTDKLIDARNHRSDAMEFSLIKIPWNLEKMKISDYLQPGERIVADIKKPKPQIILTPHQKMIKAHNPFNFANDNYEEPQEYNDADYENIINKLSGI